MRIKQNIERFWSRASGLQRAAAVSVLGGGLLALGLLVSLASGADEFIDPARTARSDVSLFDSEFWLSGNPKSEALELSAQFAVLLDETNPRTGEAFTEAEAKKVQYLATLFPENELIPRPDIPDYQAVRAERAKQHEEMGYVVAGNEGTPADVEAYYGRIQKQYGDQIQLLEYALENEQLPEEYRKRMEKMLAHSHETHQLLKEQKERSLAILERRAVEGDQ